MEAELQHSTLQAKHPAGPQHHRAETKTKSYRPGDAARAAEGCKIKAVVICFKPDLHKCVRSMKEH